jgi:hypothetical protein
MVLGSWLLCSHCPFVKVVVVPVAVVVVLTVAIVVVVILTAATLMVVLVVVVEAVGWETRRTGAFIDPNSSEDSLPQLPRSLSCGSVAARLLGLWVLIPPGARMPLFVIFCMCQVEFSASGCSLVQGILTECAVCECDNEASIMCRP